MDPIKQITEEMETFTSKFSSHESMISNQFKALRNRESQITLDEYKSLRGSSWEFEFIYPNLSTEALQYVADLTTANCNPRSRPNGPAVTYDEAAIYVLLPEAMKRLKELSAENNRLRELR